MHLIERKICIDLPFEFLDFFGKVMIFFVLGMILSKSKFFKNFKFVTFSSSDVQSLFGFSPSIKSIDMKILPASIYSMSSCIRKCIQIKIWTDEAMTFFNFRFLNSLKCCRPHLPRFLWHRITLRVWMWTSCSTSH